MQKKVLVFGGTGLVGSLFVETYGREFKIKAPSVETLDILDQNQLSSALKDFKPDSVINFAAYTHVQSAEAQQDDKNGLCYKINAKGARNVSEACKKENIHLIHISTDYVFSGEKSEAPYNEKDSPNPKNWYGKTKYFGEKFVVDNSYPFTIVRISMPFRSKFELKGDIARFFLGELRNGLKIRATKDQKITPVLVNDVAEALSEIIKKRSLGLYHVVSTNWTTPYEFAKLLAKTFGLDISLVKPITLDEYNLGKSAKILRYSWLDTSKFLREFGDGILHTVEESVELFKKQIDQD